MTSPTPFDSVPGVTLSGLLGSALDASRRGRLSNFIRDETSPAIALFGPAHTCQNTEGDWYGEHAGKWLIAAARAARSPQCPVLRLAVARVANHLVALQQPDGYLGTYAPGRRFTDHQPVAALATWDGAPASRTWDIWIHAYLVLGLLEAHRTLEDPRYLKAASRIGDLCLRTFSAAGADITRLGNHHGLSATVLIDPAVELYFATGEAGYLELAQLVLKQASSRPALELLPQALAGEDAAFIGTGKAYQLIWNLVGMAKLHRATGDPRLLEAVLNLWAGIRSHHLTLGGGPWGGVALRSREVFNPPGVFSPIGYVETCSTLAWIQLNRTLLELTGEARFAGEIETAAYNDLLGAQAPNGEDWCYYSFPNGRRVHTTYWRCCKSSGAMALEELPLVAYSVSEDSTVSVNLYGPGRASIPLPGAGSVGLTQETRYPFEGGIRLRVEVERPAAFTLRLRIPAWCDDAEILLDGRPVPERALPDTFMVLHRNWNAVTEVALNFPLKPTIRRRTHSNTQESRAPDGSPVAQEVLHFEYAAITRGPLVYATGLIDGFKTEETLQFSRAPAGGMLEVVAPPDGFEGPAIRMDPGCRPPLLFHPYYEAGGRRDGAWRLTWMPLAPNCASIE